MSARVSTTPPKACSGGIPAKVRPLIPLSSQVLDPLIEDTIRRVRFTYRNRDPVVVDSEQDLVYMIRRDAFDHQLVSEAARRGARIVDGVEVLGPPQLRQEMGKLGAWMAEAYGKPAAEVK